MAPEHIAVCDACTACGWEIFWSHRKMGAARGSMGRPDPEGRGDMRRLSALTLACILLLAACGAPAEGSASASSSGASSSSASASAQTEPEETAASAAFTACDCP